MATETKWTVEIYDAATGEHTVRECTADEIAFYETLENASNQATPDE